MGLVVKHIHAFVVKMEEWIMDFEPDVWYYGKYHTDGSCY